MIGLKPESVTVFFDIERHEFFRAHLGEFILNQEYLSNMEQSVLEAATEYELLTGQTVPNPLAVIFNPRAIHLETLK